VAAALDCRCMEMCTVYSRVESDQDAEEMVVVGLENTTDIVEVDLDIVAHVAHMVVSIELGHC
jgi:hypothetical protein